MTNKTEKMKILQDQQPVGDAGRLYQALEHTGDTVKSYGLAVYGMWVSVDWILGPQRAKAEEFDPGQDTNIPQGHGKPSELDTLHTGAEPQSQKTGQPSADDNLKQKSGESDPYITKTDFEPDAATARQAMALGEQETHAVGNSRVSDTTGQVAEGAQNSSASSPEISLPGAGPAASQMQGTQPVGEQYPADVAVFTEIHALQHIVASWPEPAALEMGASASGNVTIIAGDYYDIQISFDFGSFNSAATPAGGAEISFGSVLHSPASGYDLIVIDQDLVEINVILQLNIGAVGTSASGLDMQTNQAVIVDYTDCSGFQVTMGEVINVASVQQINYLAGVSSAAQFNDAAILDGACGNTPSDGLSALVSRFGAYHDDLMSAISTELNSSVLHVTGTYYEINVIFQISELAAQDGGNTQLNSAVINDFDGVAMHQFVGGDEYDINAISQANYLSQIDQLFPFALSDFFANAGANAGPVLSAEASDNNAAADSPAEPNVAGPPMVLPLGIGAQSGDMTSDLITS